MQDNLYQNFAGTFPYSLNNHTANRAPSKEFNMCVEGRCKDPRCDDCGPYLPPEEAEYDYYAAREAAKKGIEPVEKDFFHQDNNLNKTCNSCPESFKQWSG
jgi:hypothetical protein